MCHAAIHGRKLPHTPEKKPNLHIVGSKTVVEAFCLNCGSTHAYGKCAVGVQPEPVRKSKLHRNDFMIPDNLP